MMIAISLATGLLLLFGGGHYLVRHAVSLAAVLNVPPMVIGLTIVAFGTSAPELVVSLNAVLTGHDDIVIGNVIGSNIANVLLVLGLSALIWPIAANGHSIRREGMVLMLATCAFAAMCHSGDLGFVDGLILTLGLTGFAVVTVHKPMGGRSDKSAVSSEIPDHSRSVMTDMGLVVVSLAALAAGSHMFVDGAVGLSRMFGISEAVIGLTVVAIGTAAPEIVTAAIAAWQRLSAVAIGNVLGSNIFNILGIAGIAGLVAPLTGGPIAIGPQFAAAGLAVLLITQIGFAASCLLCLPVGRGAGALLLAGYAAYMLSLF